MNGARRRIGTLMLMLGAFFCPFGFDAATAIVMEWTGSYWITMGIFYLLSALCFTSYCLLLKHNPFEVFKKRIKGKEREA